MLAKPAHEALDARIRRIARGQLQRARVPLNLAHRPRRGAMLHPPRPNVVLPLAAVLVREDAAFAIRSLPKVLTPPLPPPHRLLR